MKKSSSKYDIVALHKNEYLLLYNDTNEKETAGNPAARRQIAAPPFPPAGLLF